MRLSPSTISTLAEFICGSSQPQYSWDAFRYRSSSLLTEFLQKCDLPYAHDGSTRKWWVKDVLNELNAGPASNVGLSADAMIRVIQELLEPTQYQRLDLDRNEAIKHVNTALARDGLQVYLDEAGQCQMRNVQTKTTSTMLQTQNRPLTPEEQRRRHKLAEYLECATEDEITKNILVPIFRQLERE